MRNMPNLFYPLGRDFSSKSHFMVYIRNTTDYGGKTVKNSSSGDQNIPCYSLASTVSILFLTLLQSNLRNRSCSMWQVGTGNSTRKQSVLASTFVFVHLSKPLKWKVRFRHETAPTVGQ